MTDRARRVYALLRSMLDWVPAAKSSSLRVPRGFVRRWRPCMNCRANGQLVLDDGDRRWVLEGCEFCGGTGEIPVRDSFDEPLKQVADDDRRKSAGFGGLAREDERDRLRQRDRELARLERQLSDRPEDAPDRLADAIERARWYERHGDYRALRIALDQLRDYSPAWADVAWSIVYQPFVEAPVEPPVTWLKVGLVCDWLAGRVLALTGADEVRVLSSVPVYTREELEARVRLAKESLWRGRTLRHDVSRAERDAAVRQLAAEGCNAGEIAPRVGLSKRRVEQILAETNGREEAA